MKTIYDVIERPLITEKGAVVSSTSNCATFRVAKRATKTEIKTAIEKIYGVKVRSVNTASYMGKVKRVGRNESRRSSWKKAYVYLAPGSTIDLITTA